MTGVYDNPSSNPAEIKFFSCTKVEIGKSEKK